MFSTFVGEIGIIVDNIAHFDGSDYLEKTLDGGVNTSQSHNTRQPAYYIRRGDKLVQLVIQKLPQVHAYAKYLTWF